MKYVVLIPAYEPGENLIKLLKTIPNNMDIIIVNDGSDLKYDSIFTIAKDYGHVISYNENMGKGYALKTGIKYINKRYDDYIIVTVDSDGQHKITDAIKLCDYVSEHKDTLVLGKRMWDTKTPLRSKLGNMVTRWIFRVKTGVAIYDTQSGLRAFSKELVDYMLNTPGNRFEYEMNMLLGLKKNHIKHHEISIETIYINNNKSSHFNAIRDSYKIYKEIFKYKKTR